MEYGLWIMVMNVGSEMFDANKQMLRHHHSEFIIHNPSFIIHLLNFNRFTSLPTIFPCLNPSVAANV